MATNFRSRLLFWPRWFWRQLTSMRTALILLLLLAIAAVPGSIYPQRSADPNGVRQFFDRDPALAAVLDSLQLFDVYTSVWFSAIYILLFTSLIGCVLPRTLEHWRALREQPVRTPTRLERMPGFTTFEVPAKSSANEILVAAQGLLREQRYRIRQERNSISAEKGYLKETGNLLFHFSLIGFLIAVAIGGGTSFSGQRVLVEGDTFVNNLASYDSFSPGVFFDETNLQPFALRLDDFEVGYDLVNPANLGQPIDFRAQVQLSDNDLTSSSGEIRVNYPLQVPGAHAYLTGNGFAPVVTVRDATGEIAFSGPVAFLPQDGNMTSLGVIKVPDARPSQLGIIAFFYPTAGLLDSGAYTSIYPDPVNPLLTLNLYRGDLGLDEGVPSNVYALDTSNLEQVAGRDAPNPPIELAPGESAVLPEGLGSVSFDGLLRFASLDIAHNPGGSWVLAFALVALFAMLLMLLVPRQRVWVRVKPAELARIEVAGLAPRDQSRIQKLVDALAEDLQRRTQPND